VPLSSKISICLTCGLAHFLILSSLPSHATTTNPITTLHKLQAVQDSLANGDKKALDSQARLLGELGAQLAGVDSSFFNDRQNFYTLILYLFNGGNPDHIERLLQEVTFEGEDQKLVEGALAYASGREGDFHTAFGADNLDDEAWPNALRASIYIALTPYISRKDPELSDKRLDYVRLVAPGSLFEEAALRRQIKVVASLEKKDKMIRLVQHYAAHFSNSPYVRDFWTEVMNAVSLLKATLSREELENLLTPMPDKLRYIAYLQLARLSLIDGQLEQAGNYAQSAEKMATNQNQDSLLARFYQAASLAPTIKASDAYQLLQEIRLEDLPERDRALGLAARNVANSLSQKPEESGADLENAENGLSLDTIAEDEPDQLQIETYLQQIQNQIETIDTLLENSK